MLASLVVSKSSFRGLIKRKGKIDCLGVSSLTALKSNMRRPTHLGRKLPRRLVCRPHRTGSSKFSPCSRSHQFLLGHSFLGSFETLDTTDVLRDAV